MSLATCCSLSDDHWSDQRSMRFNADGRETSLTQPGVQEATSYDAVGRLTTVLQGEAGGIINLQQIWDAFDGAGRRSRTPSTS